MLYSTTLEPYDTDQMAKEFLLQFSGQAFTVGQQLAFSFLDKKLLGLVVKTLEGKHSWVHMRLNYHSDSMNDIVN